MGTADLCPRVPDHWSRRRCAGRLSGDLSPGLSGPAGLTRPGQVLVLAGSDCSQPVRDWIRRERRAQVVQAPETLDIVEMAAALEPSETVEDLVTRKDLARAVERVMANLPEEQRTAIVLKEYHGLTFQEIADLVGCPLSTVKTRLYQGLTVLRRELAKSGTS